MVHGRPGSMVDLVPWYMVKHVILSGLVGPRVQGCVLGSGLCSWFRVVFLVQVSVLGSGLCSWFRVLELAHSDPQQDPTLLGLDPDPDCVPGGAGLWSRLRLDWIRHWTPNALSSVRLSRLQDEGTAPHR